eukprot:TRINITY_DN890_c0_g1_i6.p1 TRINITY_DN890_c0_g1~~TRINITY_DN890_c0_g1_i6.p1  ORF type:complete len:277 (-),score=42.03 TRINITY_DN890_c0_g1_i6:414-1244(-)
MCMGLFSKRIVESHASVCNGQKGGFVRNIRQRVAKRKADEVFEKHIEQANDKKGGSDSVIPPKIVFSVLSAKEAKMKLLQLGLPVDGLKDKQEMEKKYQKYRQFALVSLDKNASCSQNDVLQDFVKQEQSFERNLAAAENSRISVFTKQEHNPMKSITGKSFSELIQDTRSRLLNNKLSNNNNNNQTNNLANNDNKNQNQKSNQDIDLTQDDDDDDDDQINLLQIHELEQEQEEVEQQKSTKKNKKNVQSGKVTPRIGLPIGLKVVKQLMEDKTET